MAMTPDDVIGDPDTENPVGTERPTDVTGPPPPPPESLPTPPDATKPSAQRPAYSDFNLTDTLPFPSSTASKNDSPTTDGCTVAS